MDEEEPDFGTPIGKVIKHINTLCKKPQIDEQLSEALDLFKEKLDEQEKYLVNGIFKINFSEAALFLQSSTELYGKKLDLLWDELLEFHTRLIKYDCDHQKEKGGAIDKEAIEKLEERRNRYKRKKKFKLLLQQSKQSTIQNLIFDEKEVKEVKLPPHEEEYLSSYSKTWREMEYMASEMREIPPAVYKQMLKQNALKNYIVLRSQDYDIIDLEDDEFNTKFSRIPRWNHIWHFFEDNDNGLMPDHNSIIAKLRLCEYGRIRYMAEKGLPFGTPFEKYKDDYMIYRKKFLEEDAKRWQNMPLDSLEDLRKQLAYLVQKDMEENGAIAAGVANIRPRTGGEPIVVDNIDLLENSDDDSLFELSFTCDKDFMKSDLFVRLEKLSSDLINTKLRQDSGFFDFNSDSENEGGASESTTEVEGSETAVVTNEIGSEVDNVANNSENNNENSETDSSNAVTNNEETNNGETAQINENVEKGSTDAIESDPSNSSENAGGDVDDMDDVRSYISDHDYCLTVPPALATLDENDAPAVEETDGNKEEEQTAGKRPSDPVFAVPRDIPKVIRAAHKKEKVKASDVKSGDESPPKRRKLSAKQLEKLLKSKIKPVREQKFEKFFSMNYLPQIGEGDILPLDDYDSGDSDLDELDDLPEDDNQSVHSTRDEVQSVMSDHDYCQRASEDSHNDSGFIDSSNLTPPPECAQINTPEANPETTVVEDETTRRKRAEQEQYEKYLAALIESDKDRPNIASWISAQREKEETEIRAARVRVDEWRSTITPILKGLKENDFDIHEYGGKIMENIEVKETKPFKDIVGGQSSAEVVRFFISTLQLANTNNVEICGALKGQLSNDTFGVKLLTRDRYHEHLQEYLAPSEETLREKLDRVRAMMAAEEPTEAGEPPAKALKLTAAMNEKKNTRKTKYSVKKTYARPNVQAPSLVINLYKENTGTGRSGNGTQDENRDSQRARSLLKGKSIVKRPAMNETLPNTLSVSTSPRQYVNPYIRYPTDGQMPSTSTATEEVCESRADGPSNKRRVDSDEETFREELLNVQETYPGVQMQSTPRGPPPPKQVKTLPPAQKSLLFE